MSRRYDYNRWVNCWDFNENKEFIKSLVVESGAEYIGYSKPEFCAWTNLRFKGSPSQKNAIDDSLKVKGIRFKKRLY